MEFFNEMDQMLQVYWYLAIPSSLVFIVLAILTFVGVDATDGLEADFEGDLDGHSGPFQFFPFRNLIHFML